MAFGRQCLHYPHRGTRVFNWCLVPRLEWIYLDDGDADPHWVARGASDLPGRIKHIETATAVLSARDLYSLQAAPFGRLSAKQPQSMKIFSAAALRELAGSTYSDIATQLAYADERAGRRAVAHGRKRWSRLGAWPWAHWDDGRPPGREWWTVRAVRRTLELWLADAERAARADRDRQMRWYRLAGRLGESTDHGYRQTFADVTPPPRYNMGIRSATSEAIYVPETPDDWSSR